MEKNKIVGNPIDRTLILSSSSHINQNQIKGDPILPFINDKFIEKLQKEPSFDYIEEETGSPQDFLDQYHYLGKLYEVVLESLSASLNHYHNESLNDKQWELIIGPWLRIYLEALLYRWQKISMKGSEKER